jgi:hypothetical protein
MPAIMTPSTTRNNNPRAPFLLTVPNININIKPSGVKPKELNNTNINMNGTYYS